MQNTVNEQLLKDGKAMKTRNIIGIVLIFTLIGIFASVIISLIDSIKIITTDYKNQELNDDKLLWGILGLVLLGNIACLIFASKMISVAEAGTNAQDNVNESFVE